ncbi:MAG: hypothetical protein QW128_07925 [Thermoprotei archaeon]
MKKQCLSIIFMFILVINTYIVMLMNVSDVVWAQQYYGSIEYYNYIDGANLTTSMVYINITIYKSAPNSLWLIVPKNWNGNIISSNNLPLNVERHVLYLNNEENPFYVNLTINYHGPVSLSITYKHPYTLLIVEPNAAYFSPLLGHSLWLRRTYVLDIRNVSFREIRSVSPSPAKIIIDENGLRAIFEGSSFNRVSLFLTVNNYESFVNISKGDLVIRTPERYYSLARDLLDQVYTRYNNMTKLFGFSLEETVITFYVPESQSDFSVGGYVPYSGGNVGDIHVNLIYYRGVDGEISLIILHELVHRFLFKLNINPYELLWVHEGLAEFISTSLIKDLPASINRIRLLNNLARNLSGYGFIENWKPSEQVSDILVYYAASYAIFEKLSELYGGLDGYSKFFRVLSGRRVSSTQDIIEALNDAWNTDVTPLFIKWGFTPLQRNDVLSLRTFIENVAHNAESLPWWMQSIRWITEIFINMARDNLEKGRLLLAGFYASVALIIYMYVVLLPYIVLVSIILLILLYFKKLVSR